MGNIKMKERAREMAKEKGTAKKVINFESMNAKATERWLLSLKPVTLKNFATFTTLKNGYTFRHTE
jgi:hypothetical protein